MSFRLRSLSSPAAVLLLAAFVLPGSWNPAAADDAEPDVGFFRGLNLNGPSVRIDGNVWEGADSGNYVCTDKAFDNQSVPLLPAADAERARMIRSSRWGGNRVELTNLPAGVYSVFLYVWEDNDPETYSVFVNDRQVVSQYRSGEAGRWEKLGPWHVDVDSSGIVLSSRGGTANFSGIEIWAGRHDGHDAAPITSDDLAFFESRVRPVLIRHCYECHSTESDELQGDLLVDSKPTIRRGGAAGPAVIPGDPDHSLLIEAVRYDNPDMQMPPEEKLSDSEIADLEEWVRRGAPDPRTTATKFIRRKLDLSDAQDFWSLQAVTDPPPPAVMQTDWPANEIDRFILARQEQAGLSPAGDADRRTLIRRMTYDLTGLPPSPAEVDAFLADNAPGAFERVVERLLASPQYGERWGRHWLDVVRYSDTAGDNSDFPIPQMYLYRDWVIDAVNADMPYDQFVREQLAGDLLPSDDPDERRRLLIGTGYIANARRFGSRVDDYPQHLTIEDTIDNLGRTFLATTVNCARCHDHKFDPVTTEDYYALYGIFHSTRYPWPGIELDQKQREFVALADPEVVDRVTQERAARQKELDDAVQQLKQQRESADEADRKEIDGQIKQAEAAAHEYASRPLPYETLYAVAESTTIEDVAVHLKGDPLRTGDVVPRRFLEVLNGTPLPDSEQGSGRRQLADWIVSPDNPLTARVMVNRIWLYHFGRGLVPTPNDFGRQGKPPTHPELLDWLASRFVESGWSVREMHRLILQSRTWQLSSRRSPHALESDPSNELLTGYPRRRLDAESIRDTLLLLSGNLDPTPGGAHPFPPQSEWKFTQHYPFKALYPSDRRSVYLMTQRIQRHPYLAIFDGPDPAASTPYRLTSTTPLQALYLLNDEFVHEQAKGLADRLLREVSEERARIERAWQLLFSRSPEPAELDRASAFLTDVRGELAADRQTADELERLVWQSFVRALVRLNEFVYLD